MRSPRRDDRGTTTAEYVGLLVLCVLLVTAVIAFVPSTGESATTTVRCVYTKIRSALGPSQECATAGGESGPTAPGTGDPSAPPSTTPTGPATTPTGSPTVPVDVPTCGSAVAQQDGVTVAQVGCEWYPVPDRCDAATTAVELQACVIEGTGPPADDQDDPSCVNTMPGGGPVTDGAPARVQVGCREFPVPEECTAEWDAWTGAAEGAPRTAAGVPLAACITKTYDSLEPDCVTGSTNEVDRQESTFLFFRMESSQGMLIEKLGDGRIRVHALSGLKEGAGVSGSNIGGSGLSFAIAGLTGADKDDTYEFSDMQAAQDWIDWYKDYRDADNRLWREQHATCRNKECFNGSIPGAIRKVEELQTQEPPHHSLADATTDTRDFSIKGGFSFPTGGTKKGEDGAPTGGFELGAEGSYKSTVEVEERRWADGSTSATYKSSDVGGFLVAAKLGGSKGGDGVKPGGSGSGKVGPEWNGTTSTSVSWNPDGELSKVIISVDDEAMRTLIDAGVDISVALPYGFSIGGSAGYKKQEGTSTVTEMVIDLETHPELRPLLEPTVDVLFPRDEDGRLEKDDVEFSMDDGEDGASSALHDAAEEYANTRKLSYDVTNTEKTGSIGVAWGGIDLFKQTWTHAEKVKDLTGSSFEVTDVDGVQQVLDPAPKCRRKDFVPPGGYYEEGFSKPMTDHRDPGEAWTPRD